MILIEMIALWVRVIWVYLYKLQKIKQKIKLINNLQQKNNLSRFKQNIRVVVSSWLRLYHRLLINRKVVRREDSIRRLIKHHQVYFTKQHPKYLKYPKEVDYLRKKNSWGLSLVVHSCLKNKKLCWILVISLL